MYRCTELATAEHFANRCKKMHVVMLGDDGYYWVVTMAEAAHLEQQGYEYAN